MHIVQISDVPVSLSTTQGLVRTRLPSQWLTNNGIFLPSNGFLSVMVDGPRGIATVVVSVEADYEGCGSTGIGEDVELAYDIVFPASATNGTMTSEDAVDVTVGVMPNTSNPVSKLGLASGTNVLPYAQGNRKALTSESCLQKEASDGVRIATLQESASGEGSSTDSAMVGTVGGSRLNAVAHFREMLFGRLNGGSRVSLFSLDLESLRRLLVSHGIDCCSFVEDIDVYRGAFLSHTLTGECFIGRCRNCLGGDVTADECKAMASNYSSGKTLSLDLVRLVSSYSGKVCHLTSAKLKIIVAALGYTGPSTRPAMLAYLDVFCSRIEHGRHQWDFLKDLPSAYILPLAVSHGITFSRDSSMQNVKWLLQEHFDEGLCTVSTSSVFYVHLPTVYHSVTLIL
ncbi:uncharacterized protein ARMOST_18382 [Armillaria ostoyae]|uniref:Uncharacterized protein n=1 Tax=Armillaria ostoyae TaxID=47428 RepID=A0A284S1Q1_ARMOS|nr:uncharacterized protein ARMOST_18382 [Armillaria ostoyae]